MRRCAALGIARPRIAVAALNPHAGEGGLFGRQDIDVSAPTIAKAVADGLDVVGPVPGDTVFVKLRAGQYDAVVAMYHDQGHIPVKLLGFEVDPATGSWEELSGVNITLGLPIIRTSVDHGTAFDIAGKGIANERSLIEAIEYAERLAGGIIRKLQSNKTGRPMTNSFTPIEILRPPVLEFGCGTIAAAGRLAGRIGARRPLVVSDRLQCAARRSAGLPGAVKVFGEVKPEPDLPNLEKAVALARDIAARPRRRFRRRQRDGSRQARRRALHRRCGHSPTSSGAEKVAGRSVALMQVPTTSGTGSEAGTRALVTDPASRNKLAVQSRYMLADIAIVDPDLTMTVPPDVTAATGVDALAHCVEAYTSRKAHPAIDLYAIEGVAAGRPLSAARGDRRRRSRSARGPFAGVTLRRLLPRPGEYDGRSCRGLSARHAAPCGAWPRLRGDLPAYAGVQHAGDLDEDHRSAARARPARAQRSGG